MSTALRIAAVTQVLKDLLNDGLINNDVSGITQNNITVTSLPPDKISVDAASEISQLNIFMYQATFNADWRNMNLPAFSQSGERVTNPPLALDLHYILSAYGSSELHTDILLGFGMHFLHETPILGKEQITTAIGNVQVGDSPDPNLPDSLKFLSQSDLADQIEKIKITPEALSLEDISKLWAAFGAKYRPTAAYKATVILIESNKSTKTGLPVKGRNIYVQPFKQPVIETILSRSAPGQPAIENQKILNGYQLVVEGQNFENEIVEIKIDGNTIISTATGLAVSPSEIEFQLPDQLKAGMHELQVVHPRLMGKPPFAHEGVGSKSKLFVIAPNITANPTVSTVSTAGNGTISAEINIPVNPQIQPGQRVQMLLNEIADSPDAKAYSFKMAAAAFGNPPTALSNIIVNISGVKKADYLVRIVVDGAESGLASDANGKYISPFFSL